MDKDLRIQQLEKELEKSRKQVKLLKDQIISDSEKTNNLENEIHHFQELFYSSASLLAVFNGPDHVIEIANEAMKNAWGKGDNVVGKPIIEVLPELEEQGLIDLLDNVYKTGEAFHADELPVELVIDGKPEIRYFDFTYQVHRDTEGNIIGVADIAKDITKQALLNEKIKKSELEFRELVNFMPHKISIADAEGNSLFYNKSWLDYTGFTMDEFINNHWTDITHPEDKELIAKEVEECKSTGKNLDIELRILNKNGNYKWHLSRAIPIKDDEGKITTWITSSTEIQKIKEEEQKKEDFLKLVSHELKTPVTSIKGYVQLLLTMISGRHEELKSVGPVKPYLNRIESQVERLIRLISEMLDLSRIEKNEMELMKDNFSLNRLVEDIVEDISYAHKEVQIKIEHACECDVIADRDRIGQVVINFITNALKYSPDKKDLEIKVFNEAENNVAISVKDFGIGIAKKDLKNIFKRFYRVSGKNEGTYSGFGIGLYLSNEIIERHQGEIKVYSEPGKGSEFIFTLPLNNKH